MDTANNSSTRRVEFSLAQIADRDPSVRAWAFVDRDGALRAARRLDFATNRGPLHGAPVGIKDVIDTVDQPTAYGFAPYASYLPQADSAVVRRVRELGMVVIGKTATTEFASPTPETAPTRNPLDLDRSPGFSSAGSAAAVADGMVPFAIGTQTGASVIRPAANCGIYGYKPTLDAIDPSGIRHFKPSMDTLGLFARTFSDLLAFAAGFGLRRASNSEPPVRIGVCRTRHWAHCSPAAKTALGDAADLLADRGAEVTDIALPRSLEAFDATFDCVMAFEHARTLTAEFERWPAQLHPWNREQCERGRQITSPQYRDAQATAAGFRADYRALFDTIDVILTPSAEDEAPPIANAVAGPWFRDWTFLHGPALSIPWGQGSGGLPLGLQLVGAAKSDSAFLSVAQWVHEALNARQ